MNAGMNVSNNNDPRLCDKIKELDDIRSKAITGVILLAACGILFLFGVALQAERNTGVLFVFAILVAIVGVILLVGTRKKFKETYKAVFVDKQLRNNFQNVVYDWKSGFYENAVKSFGLCAMGNRFSSEDYLRADFAGVPFESADVTVQQVTSTGKSTHVTTYFKGRMLVFDFPSKFVNSVQIFTDTFRYRGKPLVNVRPQKVEMEGVEFNKQFDIFALSPHDAFYLLTPQFMEDMMALSSRYRSMAVHVAGNKVFVGFNEPFHNAFDADSMFNKISYPDEMQAIQRDIDDIKNFITIIRGIYNNYNTQNNYNVQNSYNDQNNYNVQNSNYNANDYYQTV